MQTISTTKKTNSAPTMITFTFALLFCKHVLAHSTTHVTAELDIEYLTKSVVKVHTIKKTKQAEHEKLKEYNYLLPNNTFNANRTSASGVIYSSDGYILTAYHAVQNNKKIKIETWDGKKYHAELIKHNKTSDVALLKITASKIKLTPAVLAKRKIKLAEDVTAISNPFGLPVSVSRGIISAVDVRLNNNKIELLQTDASVNPGSSGGALIDNQGEMIGLITKIYSPSGTYSGLSFAVDSATLAKQLQQWKITQKVKNQQARKSNAANER